MLRDASSFRDFGFFLKCMKEYADHIDETTFYFTDDPERVERYIGYLPNIDKEHPYWVGYCDIPDGGDFATAEELLEAKIYDGKSIKDRWDTFRVIDMGMLPPDHWLKLYYEEE